MAQQPSQFDPKQGREGNTYRFQRDALKAWLEKQAASGDKDAGPNDSTTEGGQKEK